MHNVLEIVLFLNNVNHRLLLQQVDQNENKII